MFIYITDDGRLSLKEIDNMKSFSIVEQTSGSQQGSAAEALKLIAEPAEENHFWLDAEAVVALSSRAGDQQWVDAFWSMLKAAEPYGFSDIERKRVKAHVTSAP